MKIKRAEGNIIRVFTAFILTLSLLFNYESTGAYDYSFKKGQNEYALKAASLKEQKSLNNKEISHRKNRITPPRYDHKKKIWRYCLVKFGTYPQKEIMSPTNRISKLYYDLQDDALWNKGDEIEYEGKKYIREQMGGRSHIYEREPIYWRVLEVDNGQAVLLSDKVLDCFEYNDFQGESYWSGSVLRSWLNGYGPDENEDGYDFTGGNFISYAFTPDEAAHLISYPYDDDVEWTGEDDQVDDNDNNDNNDNNVKSDEDPGSALMSLLPKIASNKSSIDMVTIPSFEDIRNDYWSFKDYKLDSTLSDDNRLARSSDYAIEQGCNEAASFRSFHPVNLSADYLLRTLDQSSDLSCLAVSDGIVSMNDSEYPLWGGVRPMIRVPLDYLTGTDAYAGESDSYCRTYDKTGKAEKMIEAPSKIKVRVVKRYGKNNSSGSKGRKRAGHKYVKAKITFSAVDDANGYFVVYSASKKHLDPMTGNQKFTDKDNSVIFKKLKAGKKYYFAVYAVKDSCDKNDYIFSEPCITGKHIE
ncbi:MAG: fibronectin type III domain-containing protein [Lachnospiraceae bacterium]|nr:fibronectin type III domain-containing protein [Lachnospiraceae bacterium]MEE3461319.1 fibronectin type III domain-containing protein [Lachnospiraceae bacterium]